MRATAEINEFPGGVEGNHRFIGFFLDQFAFENLVGVLIQLQRFVFGQKLTFVRQIFCGELVHLLFNFFEIFRGKRLIPQEFVEETVFDRWADAELHIRVKFHDRSGQKMRGRVPKDIERLGDLFR